MEYREDTGTVVALSGEKATVLLDHEPQEAACAGCHACSVTPSGRATIRVERNGLDEGDRVRVGIPQVNAYLSIGVLFGAPILLVGAGLIIGSALQSPDSSDGPALLGGAMGLLAAMALAWVANGVIARRAAPRVWRIDGLAVAPGRPTGGAPSKGAGT
jgi:hypothetical protein